MVAKSGDYLIAVALGLGGGQAFATALYSALARAAAARGKRKFVVYVLSERGGVEYLEDYREMLLSNIHLTLVVKGARAQSCREAVEAARSLLSGRRAALLVASRACEGELEGAAELAEEVEVI